MSYPVYGDIHKEYHKIGYPAKEYNWRAYKNGNCQIFDNKEDAEEYSRLIEKFQVNEFEYATRLEKYYAQETIIFNMWHAQVREYFTDFTDEEFNIIYEYSYYQAHTSGYDYVFSAMQEVSKVVASVRKLYLN